MAGKKGGTGKKGERDLGQGKKRKRGKEKDQNNVEGPRSGGRTALTMTENQKETTYQKKGCEGYRVKEKEVKGERFSEAAGNNIVRKKKGPSPLEVGRRGSLSRNK